MTPPVSTRPLPSSKRRGAAIRTAVTNRGRAEDLGFSDDSFDLVVSYLSLIDIPDFRAAIAEMARVLQPGGILLIANMQSFASAGPPEGWVRDADGKRLYYPVDDYLEERSVRVGWKGIDILNWHRPLSAYMTQLLDAGLILRVFDEPAPHRRRSGSDGHLSPRAPVPGHGMAEAGSLIAIADHFGLPSVRNAVEKAPVNAPSDIDLSDSALAEALIPAVIEAGAVILAIRDGGLNVEHKADSSPVTEADRAAEGVILAALAELAPGVPVIAEEACAAGRLPAVDNAFFLVDPLDGTKEFVRGGSDFTVNIGLIRDREPVLGLVYAPATGTLYGGVAGEGAWSATVTDGASYRPPRDRRPRRARGADQGRRQQVAPHARDRRLYRPLFRSKGWFRPVPR